MGSAPARARPTDLTRVRQTWNFVRHYLELCIAMCIGMALGDVIYFAIAGAAGAGYSDPFSQLPVSSFAVVTFSATASMVACMRFQGMDSRLAYEMAGGMVAEAIVLLATGPVGLVLIDRLALVAHALMMPFLLVPMLFRIDHFTGRSGRMANGR